MEPSLFDYNKYDGIHKKQKGFVIGSGHSINLESNETISKLKKQITVGSNCAYTLFEPTYLLWSDTYFWRNFNKEINKLNCIKLCPHSIIKSSKITGHNIFYLKNHIIIGDGLHSNPGTFKDPFVFWNNSGVAALRVAFILGLSPIYLIGIDLNKELSTGKVHHHNKYPTGRVKHNTNKKLNSFKLAFQLVIQKLKTFNIKVYSCSKVSLLNDILPYRNLKEILNE